MLKFLIDHNVPKSVRDFLKKRKFEVKLVKNVNAAMTDLQVLDLARNEGRIIVSNDKDFISLSVRYSTVDMIIWHIGKNGLLFLFRFGLGKLTNAVYLFTFGSMFKKRLVDAVR